jgi:hypothetical protein
VFCDLFWDKTRAGKYVNEVVKEPHGPGDLPSLATFEHVIMHEWVHMTHSRLGHGERAQTTWTLFSADMNK